MSRLQGFVSINKYLKLPSDGVWILGDALPSGGLLNIYGDPKAGKSFAAIEFASAIGNPAVHQVLGFPVLRHGTVAYFQLDTPRGLWKKRFAQLMAKHWSFDHVVVCDRLLTPDEGFDIKVNGAATLRRWLQEVPGGFPLVVVIDTLREVHDQNENDSTEMKQVIELIVKASSPSAVVLVSHARKKGNGDEYLNLMSQARGSGYVSGRMDVVMHIGRQGEEMGRTMTFSGRTASEASYQLMGDEAVDGELTLHDTLFTRTWELAKSATEIPSMDLAHQLMNEYKGLHSIIACLSTVKRVRCIMKLEQGWEPPMNINPVDESLLTDDPLTPLELNALVSSDY